MLDIIKIKKIPLNYSVSRFNLGGPGTFWGAKPTKAPRSDRTVRFLCLFFILRFHSFSDTISSHLAVLSNLTKVTMNTGKNLRLAWDFSPQTFNKRLR